MRTSVLFELLLTLGFLLCLHPSVLKPDLDLPFGEAQGVCDLDAPPPR